MHRVMGVDIETYSSVDLAGSGVYAYTEAPDFDILLIGYKFDDEAEVHVIDTLAVDRDFDPELYEFREALTDPGIIKTAFNANFERTCLAKWTGAAMPPEEWRCTMIKALTLGLPGNLADVGIAMGLPEEKLKDPQGKALIQFFSKPCKPTRTNGQRTRNLPAHDPAKWKLFIEYNRQDVVTEQEILRQLDIYKTPESEQQLWALDQHMNDNGVKLDIPMVEKIVEYDTQRRQELQEEAKVLTGLANPNSLAQLKKWLSKQGVTMTSVTKDTIAATLQTDIPDSVRRMLEIRTALGKTSVAKYSTMLTAVCQDHRLRGILQFYGANRSGRWAGRIIQLQNLPQNHMDDLEQARGLVRNGDYEALSMLYDSVPNVLSELIRTAFVAGEGNKFCVADFSAIEARVLSWLAGEQWRTDVFVNNGDIYCASASAMFGVSVEKHGQNAELRQKGKIAELALGYGGSVGALKSMGAIEMGLTEEELQPLVDSWRSTNPNIVRFWWDVDRAVKKAVKQREPSSLKGIWFEVRSGMLFITLPSGRKLAYVKPRMGENRFGGESVTYEGVGSTKKWERIESYGPKFVENIVQAISRDILCYAMRTLSHCLICAHVHDELIIECRKDCSLPVICEQMGRTPPWAEGLVLRADGYETQFYKKD